LAKNGGFLEEILRNFKVKISDFALEWTFLKNSFCFFDGFTGGVF
jgi:hypothetical protein